MNKKITKLIFLLLCSTISYAQTIIINGPDQACVGSTALYHTPPDPNKIYLWSQNMPMLGTYSYPSPNEANVAFHSAGTMEMRLIVVNALNPIDRDTAYKTIIVYAQPEPKIASNTMQACHDFSVTYDTNSAIDQYIPIDQIPFDGNSLCQMVCSGAKVMYYPRNAYNTNSTFEWTIVGHINHTVFGNGDSVEVEWGPAGDGKVYIKEITEFGCSKEVFICVDIIERPNAQFNTSLAGNTACRNANIVFNNLSTTNGGSPIVSLMWDWGDGNRTHVSGTNMNDPISYSYPNAGSYEVQLTVTNSCGCSDVYRDIINITADTAPVISCPGVVCHEDFAKYTVDKYCSTGAWEIQGGTIINSNATEILVQWDNVNLSTGFGLVAYKGCSPCDEWVIEEVPVIIPDVVIKGENFICLNKEMPYSIPQWPTTEVEWSIFPSTADLNNTDQRNEIAVKAYLPGTYTLIAKYTNTLLGCTYSSKIVIEVQDSTSIQTTDTVLCQFGTGTYQLNNLSYNADWAITDAAQNVVASGGGNSIAHTFMDPGYYFVHAVGQNVCVTNPLLTIQVVAQPEIPSGITGELKPCVNVPYKYTGSISQPGITFAWSATATANISPAMGNDAYITFTGVPNTVSARAVTTGPAQCFSDEFTIVMQPPMDPIDINGLDLVCPNSIEPYNTNITDADLYEWFIYPNNAGSFVNTNSQNYVNVQWNGNLTTAYLVAEVTKCNVTIYDTLMVNSLGLNEITSIAYDDTSICSGTTLTMTINTTYPISTVDSFVIFWGDGTEDRFSSYSPSKSHTYYINNTSNPVAYTPTVFIYGANGCKQSILSATGNIITISPAPIAGVGPSLPLMYCEEVNTLNPIFPVATANSGFTGPFTYNWMQTGNPFPVATGISPTLNNLNVDYLEVINGFNCTSKQYITYKDTCQLDTTLCAALAPQLSFSVSQLNCGQFSILVLGNMSNVVSANWVYDVSVISATAAPTMLNFEGTSRWAGNQTIGYRIVYNGGACEKVFQVPFFVPYIAKMYYDIACDSNGGGYAITLHNSSVSAYTLSPTNSFYSAPNTLLATNVTSHSLIQAPGTTETYYMVLSDGTNGSCTTAVQTITTPQLPVVDITLDPLVPQPGCVIDVSFPIYRNNLVGNYTYEWSFGGDQHLNSDVNPAYTDFNTSGNKEVVLIVTDNYGCYNSDTLMILVEDNMLDGDLLVSNNPVCEGDPVTLTFNVSGFSSNPIQYDWYLGPNLELTTFPFTSYYDVYVPGNYRVKVIDNYGCVLPLGSIAVEFNMVPDIPIIGKQEYCEGEKIVLAVPNYGSNYSYLWSNGITGAQMEDYAVAPGTFTYYCTITDLSTGCTKQSENYNIYVHPKPDEPSIYFYVDSCTPYSVMVGINSPLAGIYSWSNSMYGSEIKVVHGGPLQVTYTDPVGCSNKNGVFIPKDLNDYLWVFPEGCVCPNEYIHSGQSYLVGPYPGFLNYSWNKDGSPDVIGNGVAVDYSVTYDHNYSLTLGNQWCTVTSDLLIIPEECNLKIGADGTTIKEDLLTEWALLPNPANDQVRIQYQLAPTIENASIVMYNSLGQIIHQEKLLLNQGSVVWSLDHYPSGIYTVALVTTNHVVEKQKLIIKH